MRGLGVLAAAGGVLCVWADGNEARSIQSGRVLSGERIDAANFGPGLVESMSAAVERQRVLEEGPPVADAGPELGQWAIPAPGAATNPHSGARYAVNKHGATRMGIAFPSAADVHGAYFTGQGGPGVWARCLRVMGYRDGTEVASTDWQIGLDAEPTWIEMGFAAVDRILVEVAPVYGGAAWFGLDDLIYTPLNGDGSAGPDRIVDFEDTRFKQTLTGTDYAGLVWETGNEGFRGQPEIVPAPQERPAKDREARPLGGSGGISLRGGATTPTLLSEFQGVVRGDAGSNSAPPDSCGAIGPEHYVIAVNRNLGVYDRDTGAELINITLGAFLPGSNGDPRVLYDQHSGRFVVLVTDFNTTHFLAVSTSSDATDTWFKTSFVVSQGADAGCWPDYPTLGVDENGIYTASYMVGCGMSIFAIEKAPLIAPSPSLGAVTAFRGFNFEGAIQPAHTFGSAGGEYFVSTPDSGLLQVRRVNPPLSAPTLTELGAVVVEPYSSPPDAPVLGSTTPLDTIDRRLMNAVYRDGKLYTTHAIEFNGRAAARWYEIDVPALTVAQFGTVGDAELYYFDPSICVNADGDLVLGFSGSKADQFGSAYYTGRRVTDAPGQMAAPVLLKLGQAPHNIIDGFGRNRWGDYSLTTLDPLDELRLWTIQEYVEATNVWATWVAELQTVEPPITVRLVDGPPALVAPGVATALTVEIEPGAESVVPGSPMLHYRIDGGAFLAAELAPLGGDLYAATLPAASCADSPQFYVSAAGDGGSLVTEPSDAPASVFASAVGQLAVALADDFEADLGWSVENIALTDGGWERGVPAGDGDRGDPTTDADGSGACYLTDNTPGNSDVDGGPTRLTSPLIDMSAPGDYTVAYARWFTNDDGDQDRLDVEISNDDGGVWTLVESVPGGGGWVSTEFRVSGFTTPTAQMRVRFSATDNPNDSVTEAGVDAFAVTRLTCVDPTPCPGDLDGSGDIGLTDLSIQLANFGVTSGATPEDGDLDGDGDVDLTDLSTLLSLFGSTCA